MMCARSVDKKITDNTGSTRVRSVGCLLCGMARTMADPKLAVLRSSDELHTNQVLVAALNDTENEGDAQLVDVYVCGRYADGSLISCWSDMDTGQMCELATRAHVDALDIVASDGEG